MTTTSQSYKIDQLVEYIVCPAKCYISSTVEKKPDREKLRDRMKPLFHELILYSRNSPGINKDQILALIENVFDDITYEFRDRDIKALSDILNNLDYMLKYNELEIRESALTFNHTYNGCEIESYYDAVVYDASRGRLIPIIIDASNTKYDNYYNPIVYRCQTVVDHMELTDTNTDILVLSISSGKVWQFNKAKYSNLIKASIIETITMISNELFPARFSWTCAGCSYRGICHSLTKSRSNKVRGTDG